MPKSFENNQRIESREDFNPQFEIWDPDGLRGFMVAFDGEQMMVNERRACNRAIEQLLSRKPPFGIIFHQVGTGPGEIHGANVHAWEIWTTSLKSNDEIRQRLQELLPRIQEAARKLKKETDQFFPDDVGKKKSTHGYNL